MKKLNPLFLSLITLPFCFKNIPVRAEHVKVTQLSELTNNTPSSVERENITKVWQLLDTETKINFSNQTILPAEESSSQKELFNPYYYIGDQWSYTQRDQDQEALQRYNERQWENEYRERRRHTERINANIERTLTELQQKFPELQQKFLEFQQLPKTHR
jgi:hypothetical protein